MPRRKNGQCQNGGSAASKIHIYDVSADVYSTYIHQDSGMVMVKYWRAQDLSPSPSADDGIRSATSQLHVPPPGYDYARYFRGMERLNVRGGGMPNIECPRTD
jgi:hypothetical protein